jgi:hypothetical protein
MTPLNELRSKCKSLLSEDKIAQCLKLIDSSIKPNYANYDDLVLIINKHSRLRRSIANNTIKSEEVELGFALINKSILHFIREISDEDITEIGLLREQIQDNILIICRTEKLNEMQLFFGKQYFPNVHFIIYGQEIPTKKFDVVVLEDNPIGSVEKTGLNLWEYIKDVNAYFLYYGEGRLTIPENFISKLYISNSPFSLYARLKELLDYIKYFGK